VHLMRWKPARTVGTGCNTRGCALPLKPHPHAQHSCSPHMPHPQEKLTSHSLRIKLHELEAELDSRVADVAKAQAELQAAQVSGAAALCFSGVHNCHGMVGLV